MPSEQKPSEEASPAITAPYHCVNCGIEANENGETSCTCSTGIIYRRKEDGGGIQVKPSVYNSEANDLRKRADALDVIANEVRALVKRGGSCIREVLIKDIK